MLSVVIPCYKDPLVFNTVDSILQNAEGDIEVIVTLDGAELDREFTDPRVKTILFNETRGMREAINAAVAIADGEYLMRTDAHCMFADRFDTIIINSIKENEIVVPRRYFLDPDKWEVMLDIPPVDYEKLVIDTKHNKFAGVRWSKRAEERKDIPIDETMAMQGSCWVMPHKWWDDVIVNLQSEGYGTHYQDSHEMVFKTWKAGGRLMVNKNTWYAHKHRKFPRTHNYSNELSRASWDYALETWGDYYQNEIRPKWGV